MSMYCEKCSQVFETELCPSCGSEGTRMPEPGDLCFLTEQGYVQASILADILTQSGIPYMTRMRSIKGCGTIMMSNRLFFVAFRDLEIARNVVNELFYTHEEDAQNNQPVEGMLREESEVFTPEEIDLLEVPENISPEDLALFSKKLKATLREMKLQERLCKERIDVLRDMIDDTDFMLEDMR
ncbi:MAG: hypothetical protein IKE15_05050 [Clostridia bacterium]|nr:hypothetical protein [Clostridia bacterium]